jgi:anti-sigma28 factor (negative regulator of flagellin synthesis)
LAGQEWEIETNGPGEIQAVERKTNMKITNASIETLSPGGAAGAGQTAALDGVGGQNSRTTTARTAYSDTVSLSSAGQLVNLAKASASTDRTDELASVAALVRSGQYSADTASVSRALVQGHIQ